MKTECPYCHQHYEVDDKFLGEEVDCQSCQHRFVIQKIEQPNMKQEHSAKANGAVISGWICLLLAIILTFISFGLLLVIFIPLYLAAFVLGIVAMAQHRIGHGLSILLLSIIAPGIALVFSLVALSAGVSSALAESRNRVESSKVNNFSEVQKESKTEKEASNKKRIVDEICGIKFGNRFLINKNSKKVELTSGEFIYKINPPKTFMNFVEYYVEITPVSNRISGVWMRRDFNARAEADREFAKVDTILENYYSVNGEEVIDMGKRKTYSLDNGYLVLSSPYEYNKGSLVLIAYSEEFQNLARKEEKEKLINQTDTSAL